MTTKITSPLSNSLFVVNAPEVENLKCDFIYNFYEANERVAKKATFDKSRREYSRCVRISWSRPAQQYSQNNNKFKPYSIESQLSKIISEDNAVFNGDYISHAFSDVSEIEAGSTNFEKFSRIDGSDNQSVSRLHWNSMKAMYDDAIEEEDDMSSSAVPEFQSMYESYLSDVLAQLPTSNKGLRIFDKSGNLLSDEGDFFRSLLNDASINFKLRKSILPDIFESGKIRNDSDFKYLNRAYNSSLKNNNLQNENSIYLDPVKVVNYNTTNGNPTQTHSALIGFVIDKYVITNQGFIKDKSIIIESPLTTEYVDVDISYGLYYAYTIKAILSIVFVAKQDNDMKLATCYVSSKKSNISTIEAFESKPPPPPSEIKFNFDYLYNADKIRTSRYRKLLITWSVQPNHQGDIKQFQVFRRKSIEHPFELIKQIGFDNSSPGYPDNKKYTTGETVDANIEKSKLEEPRKSLIHDFANPAYLTIDHSFSVDNDFTTTDEFIYALSSIDAHGMISNYSEQYRVKMNLETRLLDVQRISDSGAPRQYPNMMIAEDTFKDSITVSGDAARKLTICCNPEYLNIKINDGSTTQKVMQTFDEANAKNKPYYLMQFINLDNQKIQQVKIKVKNL